MWYIIRYAAQTIIINILKIVKFMTKSHILLEINQHQNNPYLYIKDIYKRNNVYYVGLKHRITVFIVINYSRCVK